MTGAGQPQYHSVVPTIRPRGKGFQVQVRLDGLPPRSATLPTREAAERWGRLVEGELRTMVRGERPVSSLIDHYLRAYKPERTAAKRLLWWRDEIGSMALSDLGPQDIAVRRDELVLTGRSPATANRYHAAISKALSVGVEMGWLASNPARRVSRRRESAGRVRYLTEAERGRLVTACSASANPRLYALVVFAMYTGCRAGECMRLRWRDVDLDSRRCTIIASKNGDARAIALPEAVVRALRHLHGHSGPVFGVQFPRRAFATSLRRAQIDDFSFHCLRHTCASYLAMSGATLVELAAALGHKTLAMTKRYSHLAEPHTAAVVDRMAERFPITQ